MNVNVPEDGEIHLTMAKGRLVVDGDTPFCQMWMADPNINSKNYIGIGSDELFGSLGQSSVKANGNDRQVPADRPECFLPNAVMLYGRRSEPFFGSGYTLTLAVWQGDPDRGGGAIVQALTRSANQVRKDAGNAHPDPRGNPVLFGKSRDELALAARLKYSEQLDTQDMFTKFAEFAKAKKRIVHLPQ